MNEENKPVDEQIVVSEPITQPIGSASESNPAPVRKKPNKGRIIGSWIILVVTLFIAFALFASSDTGMEFFSSVSNSRESGNYSGTIISRDTRDSQTDDLGLDLAEGYGAALVFIPIGIFIMSFCLFIMMFSLSNISSKMSDAIDRLDEISDKLSK